MMSRVAIFCSLRYKLRSIAFVAATEGAGLRDARMARRHIGVMGGSLDEARRRLPSLQDLEQAAALLKIPGLDEADRNAAVPGAPPAGGAAGPDRRLGRGLCARAGPGARRPLLRRCTRAVRLNLIETVDEHQADWWPAGLEGGGTSGIEESPYGPATYAVAVMNRYPGRHARHARIDYEDDLDGRAPRQGQRVPGRSRSVTAAHPHTAPDPDRRPPARYAQGAEAVQDLPHAVEIRQIRSRCTIRPWRRHHALGPRVRLRRAARISVSATWSASSRDLRAAVEACPSWRTTSMETPLF